MYTAKDIRNLALLGHGGDGKSALCESMLYVTKAITRLGKRADGTTVSDFDDEEKKRQYSIKTSVIPVEFGGCKLNVLDNPGYFDFAAEIVQSLRVADAGLICLTAKSGIAVGTEKGWKSLADAGLPAMFYVSKLDEEHANFFNTFDSLRDIFGASVIPFTFPILHGEEAVGVVDLVSKKAYDVSGKEIALPAEAEEKIEEYMAELNEQVAETDEALMEKFFMEEPFTEEELLKGIKEGIRQRSVTPVFCGCAMNGLGTAALLALGCHLCRTCQTGRCSWGIATQNPELVKRLDIEAGKTRLVNLLTAWKHEIKEMMGGMGINSIEALKGNRLMLRGVGMTDRELEILGIAHAGE